MADPLACAHGLSTRRARDGSATAELVLVLGRTRRTGFDHVVAAAPPEVVGCIIVFVLVAEPVDQGIVQSLDHPGANITGFAYLERTIGAKWLGLLVEVAPKASIAADKNAEDAR